MNFIGRWIIDIIDDFCADLWGKLGDISIYIG